MVKGHMIRALDWSKKPGDGKGLYSYRLGGVWNVEVYGPGYSQTWRVTEYDDVGLKWLLKYEIKEEQGGKDRTV